MNFAEAMKKETEKKYTENGALAYSTSGNGALLDFFSTCGALRSRSEEDIRNKFAAAFNENPLLATKALFYTRDIRQGGLGERRTFRICLKWLSDNYPEIITKNLPNISFFGRIDDMYCLFDTEKKNNKKDVLDFIGEVLMRDTELASENKPISLIGKWLPSVNTSSSQTRRYATIIRKHLCLSEREYRKLLSALRKYIKVVERQMSLGQWKEIEYPTVPSYAMKNYRKAFAKRDNERFSAYIQTLKKGETKVNASTLFPYDLVHQYADGFTGWLRNIKEDAIIEEQWKALPNYVEGENNFVIMADVSGSMYGRPIETSIGLASFFAQRNHGMYKGPYMTFTDKPHFIDINNCNSLAEIVVKVSQTEVGYSTNLEKAFKYILNTAVKAGVSPEEMPKALVVISDMEIDPFFPSSPLSLRGYRGQTLDFIEQMKIEFAAAGYTCPKLVLFNVESRQDTFLSQNEDIIFVSGQSATVFRRLCKSLEGKTAYDFMCETLNNPVYDCVII